VTAAARWLAALWPIVAESLPAPPARVIELGCGPLGGLVPRLASAGYDAVGVDPKAPEGDEYRGVPFEELEPLPRADAVVAATSLHHVGDPRVVVDRIASALEQGGTVVVVEWAWEDFDEATARWCFDRLGDGDAESWLHRRRDGWLASGRDWPEYFTGWAQEHGLHPSALLLRLLDERFEREQVARGPYFFPNLERSTEEDERAAIAAGEIRPPRVDYVARLR
jgi:SAM-dependent methyltransferase